MKMLQNASRKQKGAESSNKYGFSRIETLPMLPQEEKARLILKSLSEDPGILACMEKHKWHVGCLAEMYPEGEVGVSEVCLLGLNRNKGQKILLRLRTDDLLGFRKILTIRKVLFHELAHNVYSNHGEEFFKLMRQIEKECNELDWSRYGQKLGGENKLTHQNYGKIDCDIPNSTFLGGTYKLGSNDDGNYLSSNNALLETGPVPARELAAKAALQRRNKHKQQDQQGCGCNTFQPSDCQDETEEDVLEQTES
jgi:hypothetical protein